MTGDHALTAALDDCTLDEFTEFRGLYRQIKDARGDPVVLAGVRELVAESECLTVAMKDYLLRKVTT